jgi:serine/threonine protein kinase
MAKKISKLATTFDTYTIGRLLGEGGAGRVYAAVDGSGQSVAIKLIDVVGVSRDKVRRFKNELMFGLRNEHPNIVTVSDFGTTADDGSGAPFYVMPLFTCTLRVLMERGVAPAGVVTLFAQMLDGVEAAHKRGVVHRDLKPENILFDEKANRLLIADFGVARFTEDELATRVETKPGTRLANFQYASPEQRAKGTPVDARADIFALGLMLHEMITGEVPQGTGFKTIGNVASNLAYLDDVAGRMIRHSPKDRFADISEVKAELIARGNAFVHQQKLDELRKVVVPTSQITDPLVLEPPQPESLDYNGGKLIFTLTKAPSRAWIDVFKSITGVSYYPGQGPASFGFSGRQASIQVSYDQQAQSLVPMFKEYVNTTNRDYERKVNEHTASAEREMREQLRARVEAEERRQAVLRTLKL